MYFLRFCTVHHTVLRSSIFEYRVPVPGWYEYPVPVPFLRSTRDGKPCAQQVYCTYPPVPTRTVPSASTGQLPGAIRHQPQRTPAGQTPTTTTENQLNLKLEECSVSMSDARCHQPSSLQLRSAHSTRTDLVIINNQCKTNIISQKLCLGR